MIHAFESKQRVIYVVNDEDINVLRQAIDLNQIMGFLARRDIGRLSSEELSSCYGMNQVDLLLVLGSSVISTIEIAATALAAGLAKELMIVGGRGHSTIYLVEALQRSSAYMDIPTGVKSEAEMLLEVAIRCERIHKDQILLETESTNCGNNASYAMKKLASLGRNPRSILIMQDPAMQLRSYASFKRVWSAAGEESQFINYPAFTPNFMVKAGCLAIEEHERLQHAWDADRLVSLIMGEIPRLRDDAYGYGPRGQGFIEHVDIPEHIDEAYERLLQDYAQFVRIQQ